jgi:triacylglycerol esterase/lipase EstA (alpha/beta hydrolase family)
MDQAKKEMYANAWQNSGIGHIVEAGKSIGRGIKNIRTKNKAKKAERLTSAKEAVGSGTQTLKQQKLVDRTDKKQRKKAVKDIRKSEKDRIKLVKYNKRKKKNA